MSAGDLGNCLPCICGMPFPNTRELHTMDTIWRTWCIGAKCVRAVEAPTWQEAETSWNHLMRGLGVTMPPEVTT